MNPILFPQRVVLGCSRGWNAHMEHRSIPFRLVVRGWEMGVLRVGATVWEHDSGPKQAVVYAVVLISRSAARSPDATAASMPPNMKMSPPSWTRGSWPIASQSFRVR